MSASAEEEEDCERYSMTFKEEMVGMSCRHFPNCRRFCRDVALFQFPSRFEGHPVRRLLLPDRVEMKEANMTVGWRYLTRKRLRNFDGLVVEVELVVGGFHKTLKCCLL